MSIVQIYGWQGIQPEKKRVWIEECTDVIAKGFNEPLDEITIFINEIPSANWGQAGTIGTDKNWLEKSRNRETRGENNARD